MSAHPDRRPKKYQAAIVVNEISAFVTAAIAYDRGGITSHEYYMTRDRLMETIEKALDHTL